MSLLDNIRRKSPSQKITIIWIIVTVIGIILIILWIISTGFHKHITADTSLFDTIKQGIKNVSTSYRNR